MNPRRKRCSHYIHAKGYANDDELHINTQSSSHWDGLRHYPYQGTLEYYNGATQEDISGPNANTKIGIQNMKPIVTRGVLLDCAIPLSHLQAIAAEAGITFRQGDVLLIRTGWTAEYFKLSDAEKEHLGGRDDRASCGIEATEESIQWHWDHGFAAVASDTVAYEAWPSPKVWGVSMHEVFLSGWGMPIGEQWDLRGIEFCLRRIGTLDVLVDQSAVECAWWSG
ncbi:cyclase [Penicillium chermesinum]|nr:cyclase [Penicillium chermesinum]